MKKLAIIGSSGSIGKQVKRIVMRYPDLFCIHALCVNTDVESLYADVEIFRPRVVGVSDPTAANQLDRTRLFGAKVVTGSKACELCATESDADTVVVSVVGMVGLRSVMAAIAAGKDVALANKESLVTGGELVMEAARQRGVSLTPIDSEHSAIWQALRAGGQVYRLILTASGGPFRGYTREQLETVTVEQALEHPTWKMGAKITVDSATMMNKGLEIIEAQRLFGSNRIDVVVQPTSVVHSMVEFVDGSIVAQMSYPTMEIPIQLALTNPDRYETEIKRLDFAAIGKIEFEPLDEKVFGCVNLARKAMELGGYAPTVLNAADEAAVQLFLDGIIKFTDIEHLIEESLSDFQASHPLTVDGIYDMDRTVKTKLFGAYNRQLR